MPAMLYPVAEIIRVDTSGAFIGTVKNIPHRCRDVSFDLIAGLVSSTVSCFHVGGGPSCKVVDGPVVGGIVGSVVELVAVNCPEISKALRKGTARAASELNKMRRGAVLGRPVGHKALANP